MKFRGLSVRLAIYMVVATILVQLLHGVYRYSIDIPQARKEAIEDINHVVSSLKPALSFALFQFDETLSDQILKTFHFYDPIIGVWLLDEKREGVGIWVRTDDIPQTENAKEITWSLEYLDKEIGFLVLQVNMDLIDEQAASVIWEIIGFSLLMGLITLLILFVIAQWFVTKPIESLARFVGNINVKLFSKSDISQLDSVNAYDEIDDLRVSVKNILSELVEYLGDNEQAMILLKEFNQALEEKVTQRTRQLQEAKDKAEVADRAKTDFLNVMTHELRTPLNGVLGFSSILKTRELSDKDKRLVEGIEQSGQGLLTLLNDIIDFVELESKPLSKQIFSVHDSLSSAVKELERKAQEKGLQLLFDVDDTLILNGDPKRLNVIARQLISNGIKFTDQGSVGIEAVSDGNSGIILTVSDTGVGMDEATFQLFKESVFNQQEQGLDRTNEGLGLGIAIVNRICKKWSGKWWFEKNTPQGIKVKVQVGNLT